MTWYELEYRQHHSQPRRWFYAPFGDLDFLDLPAPIESVKAGGYAVVFMCSDRGIYVLWSTDNGQVEDATKWRVELLRKVP